MARRWHKNFGLLLDATHIHKSAFTTLALFACHSLFADYYTEFIKYEAEPEFSRVVISYETIRGGRAVDYFASNSKEYEKDNMFYTRGKTGDSQKILKQETIDGHSIETHLTIYPPTGRGYGGAVPKCYLQVYFDEKLSVNCPIGYHHHDDLHIRKVVIHAQEMMVEAFTDKVDGGVVFSFLDSDEMLVLNSRKIVSQKRETALPYFLEVSALKNVRDVKIVDEGIYPYVEREYELIEKGSVKKFRVTAPFRVFCKELEQLKILVNGEGIKRIKESEGNYRYELVD
jgi:hypothetical protein